MSVENNTSASSSPSGCQNRAPDPSGSVCGSQTHCMVEAFGYWWWTNYPFNISNTGYWFNGQQWDPRLITTDTSGNLQLDMQQTILPNAPGAQWSSVEAVLWGPTQNNPNSPATPPQRSYLDYGKILVSASTPTSFADLANQCTLGIFTYRFDKDPSQANPYHELDMLECSPYGTENGQNAQFTLQPWQPSGNVHRITIATGVREITVTLDWQGEGQPVTFSQYDGIHTLATLPATPANTWTTPSSKNQYIPNPACTSLHLNLWRVGGRVPAGNQQVTIRGVEFG